MTETGRPDGRPQCRRHAFLAGMLTLVACWGVNRLVVGQAADPMRTAMVVAQIVAAAGGAWWFWHRSAMKRSPEPIGTAVRP